MTPNWPAQEETDEEKKEIRGKEKGNTRRDGLPLVNNLPEDCIRVVWIHDRHFPCARLSDTSIKHVSPTTALMGKIGGETAEPTSTSDTNGDFLFAEDKWPIAPWILNSEELITLTKAI